MKKLKESPFDWRLYVYQPDPTAPPMGLIKFGIKSLYFFTTSGQAIEVKNCPCVLDFYVHESAQRQGIGYLLFENMLKVKFLFLH